MSEQRFSFKKKIKHLIVNKKIEKYTCVFLFMFVPLFFVTLYLLMIEGYEDIFQHSEHANYSLSDIFKYVYNYIPRVGEFYQRFAVHFMSIKATLGLDVLFRLLIAFFSWCLIYVTSVFSVGHRLRMEFRDVFIYYAYFLLFMISPLSEIFTLTFSYAHNYVISALVAITFMCFYRFTIKKPNFLHFLCVTLLGFLFGISTELSPVIFLFLISLYSLVQIIRNKIKVKDFLKSYKLQTAGILAIICGLLFFYMGRGLSFRTEGLYAITYDYVSPFSVFKAPIFTLYKLYNHFWFNLRYLFFAFLLLTVILVSAFILLKKKSYDKKVFQIQLYLTLFSFIYFCGCTLITILDDLYVRFLSQIIIFFFMIFVLYTDQILKQIKQNPLRHYTAFGVSFLIAVVLYADLLYGYTKWSGQIDANINKIHINSGAAPIIDKLDEGDAIQMTPTPLFKWKQTSPFMWDTDYLYLKYGFGKK